VIVTHRTGHRVCTNNDKKSAANVTHRICVTFGPNVCSSFVFTAWVTLTAEISYQLDLQWSIFQSNIFIELPVDETT
jgi:hypothetical protein